MKRLVCIFVLMSFFLGGCGILGERIKEPVTFYYVRESYKEDMGDVISPEVREASGHRYDLTYLLALYSMGPSEKNLISLLPENVTILPVEHSKEGLVLSLSELPQTMTDLDYTLVGSCLAMTCMDLLNVQQVTVTSGERSITIHKDNLLMSGNDYLSLQEDTT